MSLENLFRILPDGVVSKNDIGSRRMFTSSRLWISLEANMPPRARENVELIAKTVRATPNTAYIPRYSPLKDRTAYITNGPII